MNLHELRTPHPLRDSDFAAIRARVKAQIAQREERPWLPILLRLAFAASLFVLFVPYVKDRVPNVPVSVAKHSGPPASPPAVVAASRAATLSGRRDATRAAAETAAVREHAGAAATRIEIITSDPTIRIIWLTPKESS